MDDGTTGDDDRAEGVFFVLQAVARLMVRDCHGARLRERFAYALIMPQTFPGEHRSHEMLPPKILLALELIRTKQLAQTANCKQ
jgi:hypothetical protein